jgi:phosphohistidine phosphatase SixA
MKKLSFLGRPGSFAFNALVTCIMLSTFGSVANAQTVSASSQTARATATVGAPLPLAIEDAPFSLAEGLVRELRNGGYVLFIRHGALQPDTVDKVGPGAWWKDCANTRRIAPEVQAQMRAMADAFARQRIVVQEVLTSEYCRATDTAVLLGVAPPQNSAVLNEYPVAGAPSPAGLAAYAAGIQQLLTKPVSARTNRVLIGHQLPAAIVHPALSILGEGHTAIFKIEPGNRFHYVTTLSPAQWQFLGRQTVSDTSTVIQTPAPQVVAPVQAQTNIPLIDAGKELKGAALLQALRKGGYNLYMRHGSATIGQDGNLAQVPMWWENCTIQRNLSDVGREQARKVGAFIRELKIPVSQVLTSQFCRNRETGYGMSLGPIEVTEDINHQIGQRIGFDVNAARFKQLAETPAKGTNRVLVSHTHGSPRTEERIMGSIQEAEIVVYKPDGKGGSEPVARIPVAEWDNLIKGLGTAKP